MKKLFFLMVAIMISATTTLGQATDLFISEYAEGSSYNKYIEIYNGTGAPVDLTIYELKIGSNGNLMENSVTLEGTLEDGGVYVVSHAQASDEILAIANLTSSSVINFNGNDALGLFKDGTLIDVIGVEGENPGVAWMVAGVEGTIDHTLIRKPDVCSPTTDWTASAGTNADDSQWIVNDINYWDDLGMHTANCGGTVLPEPTNYPTAFAANGSNLNITVSWTDATGEVIPQGYLLIGSEDDDIDLPVDGTPVSNDPNLSDGYAAINVMAGTEAYQFSNLMENTTYYFMIFPYTNAGSSIDYKTDGTAPYAEATTGDSPYLLYTDFNDDWGGWMTYSVTGDQEWSRDNTYGINGTPCALMSGYSGGPLDNEDWLISPVLDFTATNGETLKFYSATSYDGPQLELRVSTDYDGSGNPNDFTWTDLTSQVNWSEGSFEWTESGSIDLAGFSGNMVYIAYTYYSTTAGAANWEIDNVEVTQSEIVGEPTNYPTDFAATANNLDITLSWTDATGAVIPTGYLILASDDNTFDIPQDGEPVSDDTNLNDGAAAVNVMAGVESYQFANLMQNTTYYFMIYPYTNSGSDIDFKTDGTAPSAEATTGSSPYLLFTDFNEDWGGWTQVNVTGEQVWERTEQYGIEDSPCARISGYSGGAQDNEDWLISPAINLTNTSNEVLEFFSAMNFPGPQLELRVSTDYDGSGNPNDFTWSDLTDLASWSDGGYDWVPSGTIDISAYSGNTIFIAFTYYSNTSEASTWEVDNIEVTQSEAMPEPTNYPTVFTAVAEELKIDLSWADATGEVLPEAYLILASDEDNIALPQDGTPVADDTNLADGSGAINIPQGMQAYQFVSLMENTTYYFKIFPYTNSGSQIDYKTDGTPPMAQAITGESPYILFTDFNQDWGGWTPVSVTGDQEWVRTDQYGIEDSPCAKMSGYSGGAFENEDWLISPAIDLTNSSGEILNFYSAMKFEGPQLELMVSTDYDGSGDPSAGTWTDLTAMAAWSPGDYEWTESGNIDISDYADGMLYIAFVYHSTTEEASTWEVDNILVSETTSVGEKLHEKLIAVYPNPGNGLVNLSSKVQINRAEVYNLTGSLILSTALSGYQNQLDLRNLDAGMYIIRLFSVEGDYAIERLIIE
ncbi:MAG: choice-of-anchor J domain-containing protein [Bacteroidales bacterium]